MNNVRFWFDPSCPFTWATFNWLEEAAQVRELSITPKLLSLYFLNKDREGVDHFEYHKVARHFERFLAWAREAGGDDAMWAGYRAFSRRIFTDKREPEVSMISEVAEELGYDVVQAAAVGEDDSWDETILKDHNEAMELVGSDVGSPVIAPTADSAFFGPVLLSIPRGEEAGRLWDGAVALASYPDFYELKRSIKPGANLSLN
jgi:2-hydroxychromene-2-carboxylate isomerase